MSCKTRDQPDAPPDIAQPEEILLVLTQIMRGTITETATRKSSGGEETMQLPPKISERIRAAEMLGKRCGLFTDKEPPTPPKAEIVQQIEAALRQLMEERVHGSGCP